LNFAWGICDRRVPWVFFLELGCDLGREFGP
jgi:hypothetical protein